MPLRSYQELAADFLYERDRAMILAPEWAAVSTVWEYRGGELYWLIKCGRGTTVRHVGDRVVVKGDPLGYQYVTWQRKHYAVHRIVFLLINGWLPDCVDHIDGNPSNNRLDNLREATQGQNMQNQSKPQSRNKSGCLGVHWCIRDHKWIAKIGFDGRQKFIGRFDTPELAHQAYLAVKSQVHPFAPNISI